MKNIKVHLDKGGRSVSDKEKVKNSRSRGQQDLRSVLSNKERKDRAESRERRPRARDRIRRSSGDLRDRLDKNRDSDYRDNPHCDISPASGKTKLLSMFLEENPCKDFKGKENGDLEDAIEITRKKKMELEKKLSSEWSERKKKKKRRSKSKSRARERKPLTSKETENKKRKLSPGYLKEAEDKDSQDESKSKKGKRSTSREAKDGRKKKKEKKSRNRSRSSERKEKPRSPSKTSSGSRKSRIDSGISVSTVFSKESHSISPRDERMPSPVKDKRSSHESKEDEGKQNDLEAKKEETHNSPSPPRRVLERPEEAEVNGVKEDDKKEKDHKNPYSVYEQKHGMKHEERRRRDKRRSRSRGDRRSRSRERRTKSRDRHRRSKERDLKDEVEELKRERRRRHDYERSRRSYHRPSSRYSPSRRHSTSPPASSWEDKVNSFLATTKAAPNITSSLVEITLNSEILPTDFDPSKPPPGMSAVVPPDYAIPDFQPEEVATDSATGQPVRMLTDVQTGRLIHQPTLIVEPSCSPSYPCPDTSLPPPEYQQTVDFTITAQPQAPVTLQEEIAALNALNQEREKNKKDDNKPLTVKEKKKLEKSKKEIWQFVSKKLLSDPVFCNKVKKKKAKSSEDLKEKAEKCAVRLGLKLEKSGYSETRLWLMFKDNEKGIVGFHDELSAAVSNETIETDLDARKIKDRLDSELLKDGAVFKYIGQYIQANPTKGKASNSKEPDLPSTGDLQSIIEIVNTNSNSNEATSLTEPESEWDLAIKSFSPFKTYLTSQSVPPEVTEAYGLCLVLSGFTYSSLCECVNNFQPQQPENSDEPPETVYGYLLNFLREISFEKYPIILTDNIDGHTVSIVRFILDHCSKPKSPTPPVESRKSSPVPPADDDAVPLGGNTTSQLPRKKYVLVSVSVDTIPVDTGLAIWQICLHTPGLPEEEDPDFEMLMVPSGVNEMKLQDAGFMFNVEKNVWYHQGTEFGRRKADTEEKSVERLVSYLEELRGGGRGAGLNNGLVLLFECSEDFGLVRSLLSGHSSDIWVDTVRGVGCIDHFSRQRELLYTYTPPYYKVCLGGDNKWLTTLNITKDGAQRQVKIEAETRAEMVYNILCFVSASPPTFENFVKWYCYPSQSITMITLAGNLELQRQLLPLQNHVDRQLFNARVQCVLEVLCSYRNILISVIILDFICHTCPNHLFQKIIFIDLRFKLNLPDCHPGNNENGYLRRKDFFQPVLDFRLDRHSTL